MWHYSVNSNKVDFYKCDKPQSKRIATEVVVPLPPELFRTIYAPTRSQFSVHSQFLESQENHKATATARRWSWQAKGLVGQHRFVVVLSVWLDNMSKQVDISTGEPFVNHGFLRWQQGRMEWKQPKSDGSGKKPTVAAKDLDIDAIVEHVFSQPGKTNLPESVPLGQMIDILIDFWEADGLYD